MNNKFYIYTFFVFILVRKKPIFNCFLVLKEQFYAIDYFWLVYRCKTIPIDAENSHRKTHMKISIMDRAKKGLEKKISSHGSQVGLLHQTNKGAFYL